MKFGKKGYRLDTWARRKRKY